MNNANPILSENDIDAICDHTVIGIISVDGQLVGDISGQEQVTGTLNDMAGGSYTGDHRDLAYRDSPDQHPITAISGLDDELDGKLDEDAALTNLELEALLSAQV